MFKNRLDAAEKLGLALDRYRKQHATGVGYTPGRRAHGLPNRQTA